MFGMNLGVKLFFKYNDDQKKLYDLEKKEPGTTANITEISNKPTLFYEYSQQYTCFSRYRSRESKVGNHSNVEDDAVYSLRR